MIQTTRILFISQVEFENLAGLSIVIKTVVTFLWPIVNETIINPLQNEKHLFRNLIRWSQSIKIQRMKFFSKEVVLLIGLKFLLCSWVVISFHLLFFWSLITLFWLVYPFFHKLWSGNLISTGLFSLQYTFSIMHVRFTFLKVGWVLKTFYLIFQPKNVTNVAYISCIFKSTDTVQRTSFQTVQLASFNAIMCPAKEK